jgi:hypothetical protein
VAVPQIITDDCCRAWIAREFVAGRAQKDIGAETNITDAMICIHIKQFCDDWSGVDVSELRAYGDCRRKYAYRALRRWFLETGEEPKRPIATGYGYGTERYDDGYWSARNEHAWLLKAEGLTLREIGLRLGVSRERARQMIWHFGRRVRRAMKHTRIWTQ